MYEFCQVNSNRLPAHAFTTFFLVLAGDVIKTMANECCLPQLDSSAIHHIYIYICIPSLG